MSSDKPYAREQSIALTAVRRACLLTASVYNTLVRSSESLSKSDHSPVTVGDYAAQALISLHLAKWFPTDPIVGEEDAGELRKEEGRALRERVLGLVRDFVGADVGGVSADAVLDAIDRGSYEGGRTGRMWCIDPIDGTKGFLRGGQYAVCLALIRDGEPVVGVIGCPNLSLSGGPVQEGEGSLFVAVKGQGAWQLPVSASSLIPPTKLHIPPVAAPASLVFLESYEKAHAARGTSARVAELLGCRPSSSSSHSHDVPDLEDPDDGGIQKEPGVLRMDSQAKYGCLARGEGSVYMRLPVAGLGREEGYREKIWDHAPGALLVSEAGGVVSDARGEPLDFGLGRTLGVNWGVVAGGQEGWAWVLEGIRKVTEER